MEDPRLAELEILKVLHQASFNRWEKRRNYEWLLSYAIWGALSGFIAIVVFGKDSSFHGPASSITNTFLGLVAALHLCYLFFIVDATLRDLDAQHITEKAMCKMVGPDKHADAAEFETFFLKTLRIRGFHGLSGKWFADRHGLFGQFFFTVILCFAAGWAVNVANTERLRSPKEPVPNAGYNCASCNVVEQPEPAQPPARSSKK